MADRKVTLELTTKEEHALAQLLHGVCSRNIVRQFVIDSEDEQAIGRINAALNSLGNT